jgi:hypothetical protein
MSFDDHAFTSRMVDDHDSEMAIIKKHCVARVIDNDAVPSETWQPPTATLSTKEISAVP